MSSSVPPPGKPEPTSFGPPTASRLGGGAGVKLVASVAAAAIIAVIAFALFGGSAGKFADPLAQAATVSAQTPGYRLHLAMQISSSASSTQITAAGDGTFDPRDRTGSMSMTMNLGNDPQVIQSLGSNTLRMREIVHGTTIYMKFPPALASSLHLGGKSWIELDLAKLTGIPGLSSLASNPVSSDPSQILQYLRAASDSVVPEGHQLVDGVMTTHYHAELSLDRVAGALPAGEHAAAQQALSRLEQVTQIHQLPIDVWIDSHHLVHRMQMTMSPTIPGGGALKETITVDISHYGPEPPPLLPPANQVANLSALLGTGG